MGHKIPKGVILAPFFVDIMLGLGEPQQVLSQIEATKMLELRPNCELCDKHLPPNAEDARICSYECTYCSDCVETRLFNVCPTCGGGFAPRPIRPQKAWRSTKQLGLGYHPASVKRTHSQWRAEELNDLVHMVRDILPRDR